MKILFTTLHFAYFRNFESVIRELAARGHQLHLMADEQESMGGQALVERLAAECPSITWGWAPAQDDEPWIGFARKVRYALDYVRFLDPRYADAPKLRLRNIDRTPRLVRWLTAGSLGRLTHPAVRRLLTWLERSMPRSAAMEASIAAEAPDLILLASLTFSRSSGMEQLKAARALGIRVGACVMSWDHLSSKALLHLPPDSTFVWNGVQQREAVEMHGLDPARVVVTGAQCYDQWFDRQPSRSRESYCRDHGLDPSRRLVLYVCSAMSPVPDPLEPHFVKTWVEALRASDTPALREAGVVIRPHPERIREWAGVSLEGLDQVVVRGRSPIDGDAKADYFDSLYYCDAVVGLCTSAFLEAAIVGRPVLTLLLPAYRMHQDGMAHFRYLMNVGGGLLHAAPDLPAHLAQLRQALQGAGARDERNLRFLDAFIRPQGLDTPATPAFVAAVERLPQVPLAPRAFTEHSFATALVSRLALASAHGVLRWLLMDAIDIDRGQRERQQDLRKEEILSARAARHDEKARARGAAIEAKRRGEEAKARAKRRRSFSPRKQMARIKGSVKQMIGVRQP